VRWKATSFSNVYLCSHLPLFFLPRTATDCQITRRTFFSPVFWRDSLMCHDAPKGITSMSAERNAALTRRLGRETQSGRVYGRNRRQGWEKGGCFDEGRSLSWGQERGRDRRPNGTERWGKGVETVDAESLHSRRHLSTGGSEDPLALVRLPTRDAYRASAKRSLETRALRQDTPLARSRLERTVRKIAERVK